MNQHEAERRGVHGKNLPIKLAGKHPYRVIAERILPGFGAEPYIGLLGGDPGIETSAKEFSKFCNLSRHYNIIIIGEK